MNLHQRINIIKSQVGQVGKDVTVGMGKNSYKAVSHDAVLKSVNDLMIKNGVLSLVTKVKSKLIREPYQALDYKTNAMITKYRSITTAKVKIKLVNIDDPLDFDFVKGIGQGDDPSDKGAGKAYSYAVKYAYLKLFGLATGENDEARHDYSEQPPKKTAPPKPTFVNPEKVLKSAKSLPELQKAWKSLDVSQHKMQAVIDLKNDLKELLTGDK